MHQDKLKGLCALLLALALFCGPSSTLPVAASVVVPEGSDLSTEEDPEEDEDEETDGDGELDLGEDYDPSTSSDEENRARLEALQNKSQALAAEAKTIKQKINNAASQKEQQQLIKATLNDKIANTMDQITVLDQKVTILEEQIDITQENISRLEEDIEANTVLFLQRVRASYMFGDAKPLSVVLGADSYYDSLVAAKTIESVAEHDNELILRLSSDKREVEEEKASLEADMEDLEATIDQLEKEKESLESDVAAADEAIQNIVQLESEFRANLAENQKMSQELQAEMNEIFAQINSTGEYVGGVMMWPVPGFSTISSYYGWRWNNTDFHTGIDITGSGVNGSTIVAANSGTVAKVNTTYIPGKGYGVYVMIDHGGGTVTLYGHCMEGSIMVSEGQSVAKGTPIARVGSTGWSTGPHLHFEIRENNKHVNPLGYLKG